MKAHLIKRIEGQENPMVVKQAIYRLEPPMACENYDGSIDQHEYVLVSAANVTFSGPETFIFRTNKEGEVEDWAELEGSYKGGLSLETALRNAGYEIA